MYKKRLSGVVIPTITPMNEDGSIDERSLASFTEYLVQAGVDCLYPNGTNGESSPANARRSNRPHSSA